TLLYGMTAAGTALSPDVINGTASQRSMAPGLTRQAAGGGLQTGGQQSGGTADSTNPNGAALAQQVYANSTLPLAAMLTTVSRERNVANDGTPRVNINTATAQDLTQKAGLSASQANRLINYRNGGLGNNRPLPTPLGQ